MYKKLTTSAILLLALAATALGASVDLRQETADCGNYTITVGTLIPNPQSSQFLNLQSPIFSLIDLVNKRCEWEISCPNEDDHFLEFTCSKFGLDLSPLCVNARLVVTSRGQRGVFCGSNSPDGTFTATGWARLNFYSDALFVVQGFRCSVWCRAKPTLPPHTTATDGTTTTTATTTTDAPTTLNCDTWDGSCQWPTPGGDTGEGDGVSGL